MKNKVLMILVGGVLLLVSGATADVVYVKYNGTGDGSSWADANGVLQEMINGSGSGDEVWVASGTYRPTEGAGGIGDRYKAFQMKNGVGIYGGFPSSGDPNIADRDPEKYRTTLSGDLNGDDWYGSGTDENSYHVFYHSGLTLSSSAVLDGFIIVSGNADGYGNCDDGAGMYNSGSNCAPTIRNCTFTNNFARSHGGGMRNNGCFSNGPDLINCVFEYNGAEYGGAVSNYGSDPTFTDCTFKSNDANNLGGGMYSHSCDTKITGCEFSENSAQQGGGIYNYDTHSVGNYPEEIINCIFKNNDANDNGGGIYNEIKTFDITNCTFVANTSVNHGGGIYSKQSNPRVYNCVFWANDSVDANTTDKQVYYQNCTSNTINYSVVEGGFSGGSHNTGENPLLYNYRPVANSPCIDAGSNGSLPGRITTDIDGRPRFIDDTEIEDTGSGTAPIVDIGAYERRVVYVDCNATGNNDGKNWDDAYVNLQNALQQSMGGDAVLIASATYIPDSNYRYNTFPVRSGMFVYGGFDTNDGADPKWDERDGDKYPTILSGDINVPGEANDNCYNVVRVEIRGTPADCTSFDSLTITGGNANGQAHIGYKQGGGVYGTNLKFVDCIIHDNNALLNGGAICSDGTLDVVSSTIRDNSSGDNGGGIYVEYDSERLSVVDSVIRNNSSGKEGGGIWTYLYAYDAPWPDATLIAGNTFVGNSSSKGGAIYSNAYLGSGAPSASRNRNIANCFFAGNDANDGGAIYGLNEVVNVANCAFAGNTADSGGGLYLSSCDANTNISNCSFGGNSADAGNAIACNSSYSSTIDVNNCILWDGGDEIDYNDVLSTINVNYSNIQGGWPGGDSNNINTDPCFVDPDGADDLSGTEDDNLRLLSNSACIDVGDNNSIAEDFADLDNDGDTSEPMPFDIAGNYRIDTNEPNIVDMGAYEFTINVADLNKDNDVDLQDFSIMASQWYSTPSVPSADISPEGSGDGIVDERDLALLGENWLVNE